jgi:hypothetical protein
VCPNSIKPSANLLPTSPDPIIPIFIVNLLYSWIHNYYYYYYCYAIKIK